MTAWETDDEGVTPVSVSPSTPAPLPTPHDTPFRTPSRCSKRSRRSLTPPENISSPHVPASDRSDKSSKRHSRDVATDETISILDPRRFTPTLHANLVSEILNLRRDQQEKFAFIENLESALHASRLEIESLQESQQDLAKESRSLKRQFALLEGGTSSALAELARERDEAIDNVIDTKKRLEAAQKRIRNQEDDSLRTHDQWASEKTVWEDYKRKYDRKLHVTESRLKVLMDEMAIIQMSQLVHSPAHLLDCEIDDQHKETDAASVRSLSMTNSIRFSALSGPAAGTSNGHSLADELNLERDADETDNDGHESGLSPRHQRNESRESVISRLHRRNQSNESPRRLGRLARGRLSHQSSAVMETLEDGGILSKKISLVPQAEYVYTTYVDAAAQYSTPPSPDHPALALPLATRATTMLDSPPRSDAESDDIQRCKRVRIARVPVLEALVLPKLMVSTSSQTIDPPSPPGTPISLVEDHFSGSLLPANPPVPCLVSSATQTDSMTPPSTPTIHPLPVPSIAVHAPTSQPSTPRESRLPQYLKDKSCQVSIVAPWASTNASMQTEEIRLDKRLALLPRHLQPSTISSRPPSPEAGTVTDGRHFTPVPGQLPPRNPRRLTSQRSLVDIRNSPPCPLSPDDPQNAKVPRSDLGLPIMTSHKSPTKKLHRISSLLAGFEGCSSDEIDEFADMGQLDSEFRTALTAPKPKSVTSRPPRRISVATAASADALGTTTTATSRASTNTVTTASVATTSIASTVNTSLEPAVSVKYELPVKTSNVSVAETSSGTSTLPDGRETIARKTSMRSGPIRSYDRFSTIGAGNRVSLMRKAAMIQNGIATHQQGRAQSPAQSDAPFPPFPIPTRASSRRPPLTLSAPSDGQRSPTGGDRWHRRSSSRSQRSNSIRKVRSAAVMTRGQMYKRHGSRSPPPHSPANEAPESPLFSPLSQNDITTPRGRDMSGGAISNKTYETQISTNTNVSMGTGSTSTEAVGVVEAIAQTMVGEWMFKYIRRRKSFGIPEVHGKDETSNDRHKRWVWLAPYERSILWSSKQPSSGSALLGKSGRKLAIQSVLDVKDDNPGPKGHILFNRSILVLTPQRALKFTAASMERHYIWLTAFSFLAHSSQALPEIGGLSSPVPEFEVPTKPRRTGIRDSIRIAKSKGAALASVTKGINTGPPTASSIHPPTATTMLLSTIPPMPTNMDSSQLSHLMNLNPAVSIDSRSVYHRKQHPSQQARQPPQGQQQQQQQQQLHQQYESWRDVAEAPYIPRFHERPHATNIHGRKCSNAGGHVPPPLSFRGFSSPTFSPALTSSTSTGGSGYGASYSAYNRHNPASSIAGNSIGTAISSDMFPSAVSFGHSTWASGGGMGPIGRGGPSLASQRNSDASSRPNSTLFMDSIGTMRMEAFISPIAASEYHSDDPDDLRFRARRRSKELRRRRSRSRSRNKDRDSYGYAYSAPTSGGKPARGLGMGRGDDVFPMSREDPFKGF